MSEESKLTLQDPISSEVLEELGQLENTKNELAARNLWLDEEKVRILHASRKLRDQERRIYERCLIDRGLSPTTIVEIDRNGYIILPKEPETADAEKVE